ncbi:exporter of polyketide antibiotics [Dactylosporangium matsuzakiense]|uniref:Exporter of polyketide antibiotics n=2 Tax=Dactylosporangium matsuzakiense TaxID=53360 RepID=A0A9W6KGN7_9ACTN|nr:exporter of polyketide antibiotics [Dactylosporangium matsuzakiense]
MVGIVWRAHGRSVLVWVIALTAGMIATAVAVAGLYDTPAKIHTYANAVTSGNALAAINGHVEGIDSLGGVIQDEFGFLASFLLPLLGIALVTSATRRDEEAGRLDMLLGGRIARHQPTLAALLVATAATIATTVLFATGLSLAGVPARGAILYAAALGTLAFVFAGIAALLAQLVPHARGVYTWSLIVLVAAYVLRGVGDTTGTWFTWMSPLGWAEKTAPFAAQRWWVLTIPAVAGIVSGGAAMWLAARRDLGSALHRSGPGPARATRLRRSAIGLAMWIHGPALMGWMAAAALFTAALGALSQQFVDAVAGNAALAGSMGIGPDRPLPGMVAAVQLYVAVIGAGYVLQAIGTLRTEESCGRLETRLTGTLSRTRWLIAHVVVIVTGLAVLTTSSSLVLATTINWSTGDWSGFGAVVRAGVDYLPAELTLAGLALALFGLWPRGYALAWAAYATTTFLALLGPGLHLAQWAIDLAPAAHIGHPPAGPVDTGSLVALGGVTLALALVGVIAFRHRDIPRA